MQRYFCLYERVDFKIIRGESANCRPALSVSVNQTANVFRTWKLFKKGYEGTKDTSIFYLLEFNTRTPNIL